jgi:hypothetical protein
MRDDNCGECGKDIKTARMHLDDEAAVCLECWEGYPEIVKAFTNRLVCGMAKLELANIELERMRGYCNRCSAGPGETCGNDCTRDGSRDQ